MRAKFQLAAVITALVALSGTLGFLLVAPPPRMLPSYAVSLSLMLGDGSTLSGHPERRSGNDELPLPSGYIYHCQQAKNNPQNSVEIELFDLESANAEARDLPRKFGPRALFATDKIFSLVIKSNDSGESSWVEASKEGRSYFGARISADGYHVITRSELWKRRVRAWRHDPVHLLQWLCTSEEIVDRRGLWLQMWSSSGAVSDRELEALWQQVLTAFAKTCPDSFNPSPVSVVRHQEAEAGL